MSQRPDPDEIAALRDEFSDEELVELTMAAGLFVGFSKLMIVLGLDPEQMDTTVLPTPAPPK